MVAEKKKKVNTAMRKKQILEMLHKKSTVLVPDLVKLFGVSAVTIRSDLNDLTRRGLTERCHGGALPAGRMVFAHTFEQHFRAHRKQKFAIALEAAKLVKPGNRILVDTGTTMVCFAEVIKECKDITVVTSSLAIAAMMQYAPNIAAILLGGRVTEGRLELTGILTEAGLDILAGDITFQGAHGISMDGSLYAPDMSIARVNQKMRTRADRKYLLADSSKIGKTALVRHGSLTDFDAFYTDDGIDSAQKKELEQLGVPIIVVTTGQTAIKMASAHEIKS